MRGLFKKKEQQTNVRQSSLVEGSKAGTSSGQEGPTLASLVHGDEDNLALASTGPANTQSDRKSSRLRYGFHSMAIQVKDIAASLRFYQDVLGMRVCKQTEGEEYSMYFLTFDDDDQEIRADQGRAKTTSRTFGQRTGLLQLIHVHGSEDDKAFKVNVSGPGFVHFSVSVPDVEQARDRMAAMGVSIIEDGSNAQGFAAVADPDGYSVQLIAESEGQHDGLKDELTRIMSASSLGQLSSAPSGFGDLKVSQDSEEALNGSDDLASLTQRELALQAARGGSPVSLNAS